jgi:hypothetical protein
LIGTYDGSIATLFVNRSIVASQAISGPVDYFSSSNGLTIGNASGALTSARCGAELET